MLSCHRRDFLKLGAGALTASLLPLPALAAVLKGTDSRRTLKFYNTHTAEKLSVCYYDQGAYQPEALARVSHILRDHRTASVKPIDTKLLDILFALQCRIRPRTSFHVISGYRSPTTNAMLRSKTKGVAKTSYHTRGKAIDIRLPGYGTHRLRDMSVKLRLGGVGYYPKSDFVHLDTGQFRTW